MRYIHGDISHFLYKVEYDGLCQTYITQGNARKSVCGLCVRTNGKLKRKGGEVLK